MTLVAAGYDQIGTECKGKAQTGTKALQDACEARFNTTTDGIYNCRNIRGGSTKSAHAEGRAVDVHWTDEDTGRVIADLLVSLNAELGIECVIWWDRIWSYEAGHWHDYKPGPGGDRHHSHLHVEQNWSGALHLTRAAADAALGAHPAAPAKPTLLEDDLMIVYIPTDDNGNTHDANKQPWAPPLLVGGGAYAHLLQQKEVDDVTDAGSPKFMAKPYVVNLIKHLNTFKPRDENDKP